MLTKKTMKTLLLIFLLTSVNCKQINFTGNYNFDNNYDIMIELPVEKNLFVTTISYNISVSNNHCDIFMLNSMLGQPSLCSNYCINDFKYNSYINDWNNNFTIFIESFDESSLIYNIIVNYKITKKIE